MDWKVYDKEDAKRLPDDALVLARIDYGSKVNYLVFRGRHFGRCEHKLGGVVLGTVTHYALVTEPTK